MLDIRQTREFADWLRDLKDNSARSRIALRLAGVQNGLFGDVKYFGGIGELRIDAGPGYRIYFIRRDREILLLLCGGDKSSQSRDIKHAFELSEREKRNDI